MMSKTEDLFKIRKTLDEICEVPEKIISVYSLEKHVWSDSNSERSRKAISPELRTVEEFQLDPVRPFLTDILRNMAAPYKREKKDNPSGNRRYFREYGRSYTVGRLLWCSYSSRRSISFYEKQG